MPTPIGSETWLVKVTAPGQSEWSLIDANLTEYKDYTITTGGQQRVEVKPFRIYKFISKTPVPLSRIGYQYNDNTGLLRKPEQFKIVSESQYDPDGNLVQTTSDEQTVSYVNDYNSRYKTASVVNASYSDVSYTSFEADLRGGWQYDPSFIQTNGGVTGNNSYSLSTSGPSSFIQRFGLNGSKTYILTYWAKTSVNLTVNCNTYRHLYGA